MKHIKICKPLSNSDKPSVKPDGVKKEATKKSTIIVAEGLGCVPTGKIFDRN